MGRVLILGCGYTGSRVARSLLSKGVPVTVTGRNPAALPGAEVLRLDVPSFVPPLAPDPETLVLHSIPLVETEAGLTDPTPLLLDALGGRPTRMVYLSTTGVYGDTRDVDEHTRPSPRNERERLRVSAERAVAAGSRSSLILRPAAIYGPGRGVQVSLPAGRYHLQGRGEHYVSRIHVDDLAALAEAALFSDLTGAYPVADDEPCTSGEIAHFCARLLDVPLPAEASGARLRSDRRVNGTAIRRALGVTLRYASYRTGIPASLLPASL